MKLFERRWFWAAVMGVVLVVPGITWWVRRAPAPLPVLWQLPDWRLTDQDGRPFGAQQLAGKVYVANFVFTRCVSSCPRLTRQMAQLQSRLRHFGSRVHLVSVSVDPVYDTPARLKEYGVRYGADFTFWTFVTGPEESVLRAVEQGFRQGVQMPPRGPDGTFNPIELAHSNRFALVDRHGRLRGAYALDDEGGMERLVTDVAALVQEP